MVARGWACLVHMSFGLKKTYTEPSMGASFQIQLIWPNGFREDSLLIDQPETRIIYSGHVC
jgi:hypothetical protein